ncbi:MAG: hypothetical protein IJ184_05005 [Alphaproteobacteria bacterium]|nr:hypothetical protein [Alphaproteobacteria bacterium]
MTTAQKILMTLGITLSLTACGTLYGTPEEEVTEYKDIRYTQETPISLKVNRVDVTSEFTPTFTRPHVEHLLPVSVEKSAKLWAHDRLKASDFSSAKIAEVTIKDASVVEELEPASQIFEQDKIKYSAKLVMSVRVYDPATLAQASTEVEAWRTLTIPANTDIATKESYWNSMVEKLMTDFDTRMTSNINQYLNIFVDGTALEPSYWE